MRYGATLSAFVLFACTKHTEPKRETTTNTNTLPPAASAHVEPAYVSITTESGVRIDVPAGFTAHETPGYDRVLTIPSGGKVKLLATGACGRSIEKVCADGKVRDGVCEEPGARTRVSDEVIYSLFFEGSVPARVLSSWTVPSKTPDGIGYYCSPQQIIENAAAD